MVTKYAVNWRELGTNLKLDIYGNLMNIISENHLQDCESACSEMLINWLEVTPNASWEILYNAIEKTKNELSNSLEKLHDTAGKPPKAVNNLCTATNKLPYTIEKLESASATLTDATEIVGTAADKLPKAVNQICEAASKLPKAADNIPTSEDKFVGTCIATYICMYIHTYVNIVNNIIIMCFVHTYVYLHVKIS